MEQSYRRVVFLSVKRYSRSWDRTLRNRFLFSYHLEGERISVTRAGRDRNKNRFQIFLFKRIFFTPFSLNRPPRAHEPTWKWKKNSRSQRGREIWKANIRAAATIRWIVDNPVACAIEAENLTLSRL